MSSFDYMYFKHVLNGILGSSRTKTSHLNVSFDTPVKTDNTMTATPSRRESRQAKDMAMIRMQETSIGDLSPEVQKPRTRRRTLAVIR